MKAKIRPLIDRDLTGKVIFSNKPHDHKFMLMHLLQHHIECCEQLSNAYGTSQLLAEIIELEE